MATTVEAPHRIETKRPTVARISDSGSSLAASMPTRAKEPRTEITRPRDVTAIEPGKSVKRCVRLWLASLEKLLSRRTRQSVKSAALSRLTRRLYRLPGFDYRNCRADMEPFNGSFTK